MKQKRYDIYQWIEKFQRGDFYNEHVSVQMDAGWRDWFCKDSSLANKTERMGKIISKLKPGGKIDFKNSFVWFKNNFSLHYLDYGNLYDSFTFSNIISGDNMFSVLIDSPYEKEKYAVYSRSNNFIKPVFTAKDSRKLVEWFNQK